MSGPTVLTLTTPPDWMAQGRCAQVDPELFFPPTGGATREAKQVCARCPVREQCLAYALSRGERFGIWGGLGERSRRRLKTTTGADASGRGRDRRTGWVARLVRAGQLDVEIAELLGCSTRTVGRIRRAAGIAPARRRDRAGGQRSGSSRPVGGNRVGGA